MFDFSAATTELGRVLTGVRDDQLDDPTPCVDSRVRDLIDHVEGFAVAFTAAATKTSLPASQASAQADGSRIGTDWRERIAPLLETLADAWRDPAAWDGKAQAGPIEMPAPAAASVALDEILVHGWDIAVATGQRYRCTDDDAAAALQFVQPLVEQNPGGTPGLFGPAVKVPGEASAFDQLLGLTGRDPEWRPANG